MNLLPPPRSLQRRAGYFVLPLQTTLQLDATLTSGESKAIVRRLQTWKQGDVPGPIRFQLKPRRTTGGRAADVCARRVQAIEHGITGKPPDQQQPAGRSDTYQLEIRSTGVQIDFHGIGGLRAAVATLRQLLRECGRRLPCVVIRDRPDFPRRGFMLDVSRGRVPKLQTLLELADQLADLKINELQLYTEHTFAYRNHRDVWREWGALTASDIRRLDARCRELGIDLVPNQNSFGHLREFLASPKLAKLAEISAPWPDGNGSFWRYPSTLAPNYPGTLPFLRGLYDELLPNFTSRHFNVGCDETWDLGRGQSRKLCQRLGRDRVYLQFLKRIHREVSRRGRRMMFWGDIILRNPRLIRELPRNVIALNWGYEADHPFLREARHFAKSGIPFYVCPGTSTWATLIGKHDTAFANLRAAARAGRVHGASGYLITDWGDGGHPQPLAVSWLPIALGASVAWNGKPFDLSQLLRVASRDIFHDSSGRLAKAAMALGLAHRKLGCTTPNATPLGAVIAAPRPETHELFCRDGLKYYARIPAGRIRAALREIEQQRRRLRRKGSVEGPGRLMADELDLAARMAVQSCKVMLWQQALAAGRRAEAKRLAHAGIRELRQLEQDFNAAWLARNKGTPAKCSPFLQWRMADYLCARLHFPPGIARGT